MIVEIDQVAVDEKLWAMAKEGNDVAKRKIAEQLDGVVVYMHALSVPEDHVAVSLRELEDLGIVNSVTLHKEVL